MKKITLILFVIFYAIPLFSQTMEWHIKADYVDIKYIGNNLFKVKNSKGKWGVINEYGEMTVEAQFDSITHIVENRALLLDATGRYLKGIINENGQVVKIFDNIEIYLTNFQYFNEGMLPYGVPVGNYYLFGYLDINGNKKIEPRYFWAAPFFDGKAVVHFDSGNYGIIDTNGGTILKDNRKFRFMSTPVDGKLLIVVKSTTSNEKIAIVDLKSNGKLENEIVLDKSVVTTKSSDYKSISSQNGYAYYFDNAMRLISSSTGKRFNKELSFGNLSSKNYRLRKSREHGGWKISVENKILLHSTFRDVSFCGNDYAIVVSQNGNMGVLKLNDNGNIKIQNINTNAEFYHNDNADGNIAISIDRLFPASQVQIGVIGLKNNNQEEKFDKIPVGYSGIYNQKISYFIPATRFDSSVSLPIKINIYIDGMLYKTETRNLTGVHKRAFRVSDANAQEYSNPDGNAIISFNVESLNSVPSSSARIIVNGTTNLNRKFDGDKIVSFRIPVTVPNDSEKQYTFTVTIEEDGCPSYTRTINKTIKHYYLQ